MFIIYMFKNLYRISFLVFCVLWVHLFTKYAENLGTPTWKWGTVIEWTTESVVYLPYLSMKKNDKFYQSLLFRWCWTMTSGSNPVIVADICWLQTDDYQTYIVTLSWSQKWSDWKQITLNDVKRTYSEILINNIRGIDSLSSYSKVIIEQMSWSRLRVSFPSPSIDNSRFFLNPILPEYVLNTKWLDYYRSRFAMLPITSSCAKVTRSSIDDTSIVFDTSHCTSLMSNRFQIKQFSSVDSLESYIKSSKQTQIDFFVWSWSFTWYHSVFAPSSLYLIAHMNANNLSDQTRRHLGALLLKWQTQNKSNFVPYQWMLSYMSDYSWWLLRLNLGTTPTLAAQSWWYMIPVLTKSIYIQWTNKFKEWFVDTITDRFVVNFKIDWGYDKIWVAANGWWRYYPESYKKDEWSVEYAMAPKFNNIKRWINYYTVWWIKWSESVKLMTLTVHYLVQPSQQIQQKVASSSLAYNWSWWRLIRIMYVQDQYIDSYLSGLKTVLSYEWFDSSFEFIPLKNRQELEAKTSLNEYEAVITLVDFWLKADLSVLVSDDQTINYSRFKDPNFRRYLSEYYLSYWAAQKKLQASLQQTYYRQIPFVILGKVPTVWSLRDESWIDVLPVSYDETMVRALLINASSQSAQTLTFDSKQILDWNNFIKFILWILSQQPVFK